MRRVTILFCAALILFAPVAVHADEDYVRIAINGTNVNLRPQPIAEGRVTAQMSTGDVFIAEKAIIFNKNGNSKWYKIVLALDATKGKISMLSEWDSRFGENVAFVNADYATASPLEKGDMEKIKATSLGGSEILPEYVSIAGYSEGEVSGIIMSGSGFLKLCGEGSLQEINESVKNGADVSAKDSSGRTALMYATGDNENAEVTSALLAAGANVNVKDSDGRTALIYAAWFNKDPEVIEVLVKAGADVKAKDGYGMTALLRAAQYNENPEVISVLLKSGADANDKDEDGKRTIDYAKDNISLKNTGALKELEQIASRHAVAAMSANEIINLCRNGTLQQVEESIQAGMNVNASNDEGRTVLMHIAEKYSAEVLRALIKAGADVNARMDGGWTALTLAAQFNENLEITSALIKAGADVNVKSNGGWTPLMLAARFNGNFEVTDALIAAGANVNAKMNDGWTPLMSAARYNAISEVTGTLIKAGADVNAKKPDGYTSLMLAAGYNENPDIISVLLKYGADAKARNIDGKCAVDYIWENEKLKNTDAVRQLEQAVASTETTDTLRVDPIRERNVEYVRLYVMGVNVNVRDAPGTSGKVLFQANPGDGFIAGEELVINDDGSKWYKIVMTAGNEYVPLAAEERFGVAEAYISANFVSATKLNEDEEEKIIKLLTEK